MGCTQSQPPAVVADVAVDRHDSDEEVIDEQPVFTDYAEAFLREPLCDVVVTTAAEYVLAASTTGPCGNSELVRLEMARDRFKLAYKTFISADRAFPDDATTYLYARCALNALKAGVELRDAPLPEIVDGVHRRY